LIVYTIETALASRHLARVVVSTEDAEVATVARRVGAEVPFVRPIALAQDDTPMLPVVQHAVRTLEAEGDRYDAVCLLQPTSPFRESGDIDGAVELLLQSGADAVVTVSPVPSEYHPSWVYLLDEGGNLRLASGEPAPIPRRQELPPAFHREGSVYLTRVSVIHRDSLYGDLLRGYVVRRARSVNIDTMDDWARAERLLGAEVG
jgi:CMP-N-acetylneuraminic acid synthetase